jgi:hypothetical protein
MKRFTILLLTILFSNCVTAKYSGNFIGKPDFKDFNALSKEKITGEACTKVYLSAIVTESDALNQAYNNALQKAPGATGLADVEIQIHQNVIPLFMFVYWSRCYEVTGTPATRK